MLDRQIEYKKMAEAEGQLWWYRTLHRLILDSIKRFSTVESPAILDAPCGTGGLLQVLQSKGYKNIQGVDISPHALEYCNDRWLPARFGDLRSISSICALSSIDIAICNDGLPYFKIEEQIKVVDEFYQVLKPDGIFCANLPALKVFSGMHDKGVGIVHRSERADIDLLFPSNKFEILKLTSWPFFLSPLVLGVRIAQRFKMKSANQDVIESDVSVPIAPVNRFFESICWLEHKLFSSLPFGSSLFVVARKR